MCVDLVGPFCSISINGNKYTLLALNNSICYFWYVPIESKAAVQHALPTLLSDISRSFPSRVNTIFADRGSELTSRPLVDFLSYNNIAIWYAPLYHPQSKGIFERVNLSIFDFTRCNLAYIRLPDTYWKHSLNDSVFKKQSSLTCCYWKTTLRTLVFHPYFTYTTFTIWRPSV